MAIKTIELLYAVKDVTREGLQKVQSSIAESRAKLNAGPKEGGLMGGVGKVNETLGKAAVAMAIIDVGASAVQLSIEGWNLAAATFSGNLEKQEEAIASIDEKMKGLPFGFGKVYAIGQSIREGLTGERAELEAINKLVDERNKRLDVTAKLIADQKKLIKDLGAETKKVFDDASRRNTSIADRLNEKTFGAKDNFGGRKALVDVGIDRDADAERARAKEAQDALTKVQNELNAFNTGQNRAALEEQKAKALEAIRLAEINIGKLNQIRQKSYEEIDQEEAEHRQKQADAEQKQTDDIQRRIEEDAKNRKAVETAITQNANQAISQRVKAEIDALNAVGKTREAAQLQIQSDYEAQVMAAQQAAARIMENENATRADKSEAERVLADQLATIDRQRALKTGLAMEKGQGQPGPLAMNASRFLTGASDQQNPQVKMEKGIEELVKQGAEMLRRDARAREVQANAQGLQISIGNGEI